MTYRFSEENLSQALQKNWKVLAQNLFTLTDLMVLNIKIFINKLSIKMFQEKSEQERLMLTKCLLVIRHW